MDTASLIEKGIMYLRIASRLSLNNPARLQLTELAERYDQEAKQFERQSSPPAPQNRAA
jgi:hypothetical protein